MLTLGPLVSLFARFEISLRSSLVVQDTIFGSKNELTI